jgi:hypothetical protein
MIVSSIFQRLFGCAHRRLTRPITPIRKPGVPTGETSVVCLDCGKQFAYDWNHMRIGKQIERSHDSGVLHPNMPGPGKTKMKYALLGSAIPVAVWFGRAVVAKQREKAAQKTDSPTIVPQEHANLQGHIELPHGGVRFPVRDLIANIQQSGRDYIIAGAVDCALADHPKPSSLDYWLRENFARNKETKQATKEVISQLIGTGLFEEAADLRCPDSGDKSWGLRLKAAG